jgi:DNA-binding CsgD family transcriptional regulator
MSDLGEFGKDPTMTDAEPPLELMRQFEEHLRQLHQLANTMSDAKMPVTGVSHIEFVEDGPKIAVMFESMQKTFTTIRSLDRPPYVGGADSQLRTQLARLRAGVEYRTVYDAAVLDIPERVSSMRTVVTHGEQGRLFPQVPMKVIIGDGNMALLAFPSGSPPGHLIVHKSSLLDGLISMFETIWGLSMPLPSMFGSRDGGAISEKPCDQDVLLLLAAGATDTSIARHLNISRRTAQRRVRALLDQLNVDSRFQAGVVAARRNWL